MIEKKVEHEKFKDEKLLRFSGKGSELRLAGKLARKFRGLVEVGKKIGNR